MNAIKQIIEKSKLTQKEISEITGVKESTLSFRATHEVKGTIENALELARQLGQKKVTFYKDGYKIVATQVINYENTKQ